MKLLNILILLILVIPILSTIADATDVYFFYSTTCPHCKAEKAFLESLDKECEYVKIQFLETTANQEQWKEMAAKYNMSIGAVPQTFIGDKAFIGFSDSEGKLEFSPVYNAYIGYSNQIKSAIAEEEQHHNHTNCPFNEEYVKTQRVSAFQYFIFGLILALGILILLRKKIKKSIFAFGIFVIIISIFIAIKTMPEVSITNFASNLPFPFFVFLIALADGFNPCAFTVLIILLSLLTYTKKRGDMLFIGLTFIITSAIMYFIFIMLMVVFGSWAMGKYSSIITLILGIGITIAGLINIKDYFFFKSGPSLSISDSDKLKFTDKARKIINRLKEAKSPKTILIAFFATALLAVFVNLIELGCTAILPVIYMTSLMNTFGNSITAPHILYTIIYSVVYIIPLLAILLNFIYYFKSSRLTESQGKKLKLFTGLLMLVFGLIMLIAPSLLVFG